MAGYRERNRGDGMDDTQLYFDSKTRFFSVLPIILSLKHLNEF